MTNDELIKIKPRRIKFHDDLVSLYFSKYPKSNPDYKQVLESVQGGTYSITQPEVHWSEDCHYFMVDNDNKKINHFIMYAYFIEKHIKTIRDLG